MTTDHRPTNRATAYWLLWIHNNTIEVLEQVYLLDDAINMWRFHADTNQERAEDMLILDIRSGYTWVVDEDGDAIPNRPRSYQ